MIAGTPSITGVDDEKLTDEICSAKRRVFLLAPGISEAVANALIDAWRRLGTENVSVVLDVDSEICRLGYGTLSGLNTLQLAATEARTLVCHQPGVRIGVLICDDVSFIYSPTPLLIEAGSARPDHPNGIRLQTQIPELIRELGLGHNGNRDRVVGLDPVKPERIEQLRQELARIPPVKFDLARRVRVFNSRFQFVELEMTGCFVSRKRVPIPSNLVGLANNPEASDQFHARFNLVSSSRLEVRLKDRVITEDTLARRKKQIIKDHLIPLKNYGSVVHRTRKDSLVKEVEELKAEVKLFQEGITKDLQKHMDENAAALLEALLPAVRANPPHAYTKILGIDLPPEQIRHYLERDIRSAFGQAGELVSEMKVALLFKDVAYESLVDAKFLETVRKAMPEIESFHEEHDVSEVVQA